MKLQSQFARPLVPPTNHLNQKAAPLPISNECLQFSGVEEWAQIPWEMIQINWDMLSDLWNDGAMGKTVATMMGTCEAALAGVMGYAGFELGRSIKQKIQSKSIIAAMSAQSKTNPMKFATNVLLALGHKNPYVREYAVGQINGLKIGEKDKTRAYLQALEDPDDDIFGLAKKQAKQFLEQEVRDPQLSQSFEKLLLAAPSIESSTSTTLVYNVALKAPMPQTTTTYFRTKYTDKYYKFKQELERIVA